MLRCGSGFHPDTRNDFGITLMRKHILISVLIIFAGCWAVNALERQGLGRFTFSEPHMGTLCNIILYAPDEKAAKEAAAEAFARIEELNGIMSDYKADSELMKLCKRAGWEPVPVSLDLFKVLEASQEIARLSDGAFDVSISPVVRLWRKARRTRVMPDAAEIKKALDLVDYRKIRLDARGRTVRLLLMGMLLDLGGIAKGYAADAALDVLRRHGASRALVALGGDIAAGDPPPDAAGWTVGIAPLKDPQGPPRYHLLLKNRAVSTAGDANQNVVIDGKRYSHIVDPKTGLGLVGPRSVTIVAPQGVIADGLDTAICVMGKERGLALVESMEDVAGLLVFELDGKEETVMSKRFGKYLLGGK
jgi:thiamine biosynthesis lipoprotein